ncbi:MAG: hypothetical protein H5U06_09570 [Candidatus Aminicenantes bacterium]|nr:hypothetical protein [Candidatus Aminicenantes bacterium]
MIKHVIDLKQGELFSLSSDEFIKTVGVEIEKLRLWHRIGILSFDPEEKDLYFNKEIIETKFVKTLVEFGLPLEKLLFMLAKLEKPYVYSFDDIYWDFAREQWMSIEDVINKYIEENYDEIFDIYFEDYLDDLFKDAEEDDECQEAKFIECGNYIIMKKINKY